MVGTKKHRDLLPGAAPLAVPGPHRVLGSHRDQVPYPLFPHYALITLLENFLYKFKALVHTLFAEGQVEESRNDFKDRGWHSAYMYGTTHGFVRLTDAQWPVKASKL